MYFRLRKCTLSGYETTTPGSVVLNQWKNCSDFISYGNADEQPDERLDQTIDDREKSGLGYVDYSR